MCLEFSKVENEILNSLYKEIFKNYTLSRKAYRW